MKKMLLLFSILIVFSSCSSSPKRPMLITENTNVAYSKLDEANNCIISGRYDRSYNLLSAAYDTALSVDNTELLCKIVLSGIVFKISVPDYSADENSFLNNTKEELLISARKFANRSPLPKELSELCMVYEVRILLENEKKSHEGKITSSDKDSYLTTLSSIQSSVSKEPYYLAYLYRTRGDVCMAGEDYAEAQKNYSEAAKIHTKERYLMEIGLDWYCISRSYSLAGKKKEAISAIQTALKYDRDGENTPGIASDYVAYSKILLRGNPTDEEIKLSEELLLWSEKVLQARDKPEVSLGSLE